jgi:UDP-N-acetylglucosamine transferase subunit ALG13
MIFVTLGSQKFPFDRLLQALDRLIEAGVITEPVFAQTGYSTYAPKHFAFEAFLDRDSFGAKMQEADTVITHAGTGAIIGAVKAGKKVIAVPRLSKYGEHVDDHQTQIIDQFNEMNLILGLAGVEQLEAAISELPSRQFGKYASNTHRIIADIEEFLGG